MRKELQRLEKVITRKYTSIHTEQHWKKYQIGIRLAMMVYTDTGYKNSLQSTTIFPEEQKRCHKGIRGTGELLYIDQHIVNESKTRRKKITYGIGWFQKDIRWGPTKRNNRLSENIQVIQRSHKVYRELHGKLESGNDSRRKKLCLGENPERNVPGICVITITICNSDDATESHN